MTLPRDDDDGRMGPRSKGRPYRNEISSLVWQGFLRMYTGFEQHAVEMRRNSRRAKATKFRWHAVEAASFPRCYFAASKLEFTKRRDFLNRNLCVMLSEVLKVASPLFPLFLVRGPPSSLHLAKEWNPAVQGVISCAPESPLVVFAWLSLLEGPLKGLNPLDLRSGSRWCNLLECIKKFVVAAETDLLFELPPTEGEFHEATETPRAKRGSIVEGGINGVFNSLSSFPCTEGPGQSFPSVSSATKAEFAPKSQFTWS